MTAPWEASTSCAQGEPTREITSREIHDPAGGYDWPAAEMHNGIAGLMIHAYGDCPTGAYVKVWGRGREPVEAGLRRVVAHVESGATAALFESEGDGEPSATWRLARLEGLALALADAIDGEGGSASEVNACVAAVRLALAKGVRP